MRRCVVPALAVLTALGCDRDDDGPEADEAPPAAEAEVEPVDVEASGACAGCHPIVAAEWRASMHAAAHPESDPIVGAMLALRERRDGAGVAEQCAACHVPRGDGGARRGVTCAACHAVAEVAAGGKPGRARLHPTEGALLLGPHDLPASSTPAHGTGPAPEHMKDGAGLCLACHGELSSPHGIAMCATGPEWHQNAGTSETCVSCHMPTTPGPATVDGERAEHASHRFVGPHVRWSGDDASALTPVELAGRFEDGALVVTVRNQSGHAYPTGFPGRMALVAVTGLDDDGQTVWRNFDANPMKDSPQAVFNRVFVDAGGEPTIAPWADKLARDTRLEPGESRDVRFEVPAKVREVRARLLFRLLPPPLAERLELSEHELASPRPVTELRVER